MPRNPKMFVHGGFYEICFRTVEGLPLICAAFMQRILRGCLAAAQTKYPVTITDIMLMGNHPHLGIIVQDPENVPKFCEYFKRESAHAINRLQGRTGKPVWEDGYDSPIIIDPNKAVDRLVYWYTNPAQADLVEHIGDYPNFSTWDAFTSGASKITTSHKRIPRDEIPHIPNRQLSDVELQLLDVRLSNKGAESFELTIEPLAWMKCFDSLNNANPDDLRKLVVKRVLETEQHLRSTRSSSVVGPMKLKKQSIYRAHTPKKRAWRTICLGSDKPLRSQFIQFFKNQVKLAKAAIQALRKGISASLPPSFFYPGGYLLANLSPPFSPVPST